MTTPRNTGSRGEGTVFDIGYQHYDGPREGRFRARFAVYKDGLKIALGIGRGSRAKILPWMFIGVLMLIGAGMAFAAIMIDRVAGDGTSESVGLPSHSDFYGTASIIMFIFAAISAPELLCPDRRDGVINLYLVRPLTGSDYIVARWLSFITIMLIVAWLPQIILFAGLTLGSTDGVEYLKDHWTNLPKFLGAGAALAVYSGTIAMLVSGFTTRRAYASVFMVGLFVVSTPFTFGLARDLGGTAGQWLSMFNLSNIPMHVNDAIFGTASGVTADAPASEFDTWILVSWFFLWTLLPAAILWDRYRRLAV
ncbi:ABC transporter permease [Dehalococcoides mccartyi]|nr:ABC transporter permease [Dehalococcoides mccartyi]